MVVMSLCSMSFLPVSEMSVSHTTDTASRVSVTSLASAAGLDVVFYPIDYAIKRGAR